MNCGVTFGLVGTGKSEKVIRAVAGRETAIGDFSTFKDACCSADGLQPARRANPAKIRID
jgi:hypothetical protein